MIMEQARSITKKAKYLSNPITDISVKLSSLAYEHGLEKEMEFALDGVREAQRMLECAFFSCEDVFADAIRELESELCEIKDEEKIC
mgnify:CR=1 FL=1